MCPDCLGCRILYLQIADDQAVDRQISELRYDFPWDQLQDTVVDVGGGSGHVSMSLAQVSRCAIIGSECNYVC